MSPTKLLAKEWRGNTKTKSQARDDSGQEIPTHLWWGREQGDGVPCASGGRLFWLRETRGLSTDHDGQLRGWDLGTEVRPAQDAQPGVNRELKS